MDDNTNALKRTIKTLRKAATRDKIAEGTVVKWKSSIYTYAAVFAGGKWWITGTGRWYGGNEFTMDEFAKILKASEAVEVATGWEVLS